MDLNVQIYVEGDGLWLIVWLSGFEWEIRYVLVLMFQLCFLGLFGVLYIILIVVNCC